MGTLFNKQTNFGILWETPYQTRYTKLMNHVMRVARSIVPMLMDKPGVYGKIYEGVKQTRMHILLVILYYRSMFSCTWPVIGVLFIPYLCHSITVTVARRDEGLLTVPQDVTINFTHFILISNSITHIDFKSFEYYTALFKIDLSQNPLKIIANGMFENNHHLSIMICFKCAIESAPASLYTENIHDRFTQGCCQHECFTQLWLREV